MDTIEAQRNEKDELAAKRRKDLKTLEQHIILEINAQSECYLETGGQINQNFDDKANGLRTDVLNDRKEREANTNSIFSTVSDEVSLIQGELFAERKNREEAYDKIIKKLGLEVLRLNDTLNQEKKIREETHGQLRSMLVGMKTRLHSALEVILHFDPRLKEGADWPTKTSCLNCSKKPFPGFLGSSKITN